MPKVPIEGTTRDKPGGLQGSTATVHHYIPPQVARRWVPLKGLYRGYIGIMEKKMETTI